MLRTSVRWPLSIRESVFLVPTFLMALAYTVFSDSFGKLGVPIQIPEAWGTIPNFQPRLFPMEIYLLFVIGLTLLQVRRWPGREIFTPLFGLTMALLSFGVIRILPDLRTNPMLVVRNSAFVWYLILPVAVALYPISSEKWERFFRVLYVVVFAYFSLNLLYPLYSGETGRIFWSIDYGLLLALAYGLCAPESWKPRFALGATGFALGLSSLSQIQRTTLVGILATLTLLGLSYFLPVRRPAPRWRRFGWLALGVALAVTSVSVTKALRRPGASLSTALTEASPMRPSENFGPGLEKFRVYMWRDAWNLFLSSPVTGIGFLKPVVYRAYAGAGQFMENTGSFEQLSQFVYHKTSPPIAGPHNSYLNALARLGLLGIAYLILHLASAWFFVRKAYFACLFILLWQMLYALFNVSFEGPIRSFPILLLLGIALKSAQDAGRKDRTT